MKTSIESESQKPNRPNKPEVPKKRKNYTEQLLQFLSRQTDSDRRANSFGMDPFK